MFVRARRPEYTSSLMQGILLELALLFALCVVAGTAFHWLRLPPIVGFLCAGALVGPFSFGLVQQVELVRALAEVGVVMLLFAVGMELPLAQLARLRRVILVGGGVQLVGSILATVAVAMALGMPWNQALFLGFMLSMSSTAVIAKVLTDHGEFSSPHGRLSLGISLSQDLSVVPMVLVIPLLAASSAAAGEEPHGPDWIGTLRNLLVIAFAVQAGRMLVPRLLDLVCRTRSRELFVLTIATICLAYAVISSSLGMSLAIGAFFAGLIVSETDYSSQAMAEVEPLRDSLSSLFFVSVGMLFDWRTIVDEPVALGLAVVGVMAVKAAVVALAGRMLGQPAWVGWRAGFTHAQVGEFSFVLMQVGLVYELLPAAAERVFIVVVVLSIASMPLLNGLGTSLFRRARSSATGAIESELGIRSGHAIVVGYGPTGRTIVRTMHAQGMPVVAVEQNASTVKVERASGVPIVMGDATRLAMLRSVGLERASMVVLAVNDHAAALRIAMLVHRHAPHVHVLARAAYIVETPMLLRAGASEVVPQELEASIEMLVRVLRRFLLGSDEIGKIVHQVREDAGSIARAAPLARPDATRIAEFVPGIGVEVLRVAPDSEVAGKDLARVGVRRRTGWSVVAVRREGRNLPVITPETVLHGEDIVVAIGPEVRFADAAALFRSPGDGRAGTAGSGSVETRVRTAEDGPS